MNPDLLKDLTPIVLPAEPGIWPLAIGWWLVIILLLGCSGLTIAAFIRYRNFWAVKRRCLSQARTITQHSQLNRILKQAALHYFEVNQVANLSGQAWAQFLNHGLGQEHHQTCNELCLALYQRPIDQDNPDFQLIALKWLSSLSRHSINNEVTADV